MITEDAAASIKGALEVLNERIKESGLRRWEIEAYITNNDDDAAPYVKLTIKQEI